MSLEINVTAYANLCFRWYFAKDAAAQSALDMAVSAYSGTTYARNTSSSAHADCVACGIYMNGLPSAMLQDAWPALDRVKAAVRRLAHALHAMQRAAALDKALQLSSVSDAINIAACVRQFRRLRCENAGDAWKLGIGPMNAFLCSLAVLLDMQASGQSPVCATWTVPDAVITEAAFAAHVGMESPTHAATSPELILADIVQSLCELGMRSTLHPDAVGEVEACTAPGTWLLLDNAPPAGLSPLGQAEWCEEQLAHRFGHVLSGAHSAAARVRTWTCSPKLSDATALAVGRQLPRPTYTQHTLPAPPSVPLAPSESESISVKSEDGGGHGALVKYTPPASASYVALNLCACGEFAWADATCKRHNADRNDDVVVDRDAQVAPLSLHSEAERGRGRGREQRARVLPSLVAYLCPRLRQ